MPAQTYDVFISYSKEHSQLAADSLALALRARGLKVFKDDAELRPGEVWLSRLQTELVNSACFVVLAETQGMRRWVLAETLVALNVHIGSRDDAKPQEPAPLPTACAGEGSIKDTKLCMPERGYAKLTSRYRITGSGKARISTKAGRLLDLKGLDKRREV